MNYYHMTSLDRLKSIGKIGLLPRNEENSKLINDTKKKVFFSDGFEGTIALFVDFELVYDQIKLGKTDILDKNLEKKVKDSESLSEYFTEGVYLQFLGDHIKNERNFENGCTSQVILPKQLNVCVLRRKDSNSIIFSRFEYVDNFFFGKTPEQIKYYGVKYDGSPDFEVATIRIQNKIKKYYYKYDKDIEKYRDDMYVLEYVPLNEFLNTNEIIL